MIWTIRSIDDDDGYWSNDLGWTDFSDADRFTQYAKENFSLPMGGMWIQTRVVQQEMAIEILQKSHDGNDLKFAELCIVELAANGRLNKIGIEALEALRTKVSGTA